MLWLHNWDRNQNERATTVSVYYILLRGIHEGSN